MLQQGGWETFRLSVYRNCKVINASKKSHTASGENDPLGKVTVRRYLRWAHELRSATGLQRYRPESSDCQ